MNTETFELDLITPCFCAGAEPDRRAEIRAPSIRGQLRWWFRTLGGFRALQPMNVRDQEAMIFGSAAGDEGRAGKLVIRVTTSRIQSTVKDGQELGYRIFSDPAFLTFPMQSRESHGQKTSYAGRGVVESGSFKLHVQWRGDPRWWSSVKALVSVFGHLGALGFRGRRAMGALAFAVTPKDLPTVTEALNCFLSSTDLRVFKLEAASSQDAISKLGGWLRQWRSYGRTQDHASNQGDTSKPPHNRGFRFAKRDHDIGYGLPAVQSEPAFRPALGLPIIQRTRTRPNNWDWDRSGPNGKGRFASPVLLRPHRDAQGRWHALVIFVNAHKWPEGHPVYINGQPRPVSLELYNSMLNDPALKTFI